MCIPRDAAVERFCATWNRVPQRIRGRSGAYHSLCENMEAGAIALTGAIHDVPFLAIKGVSNNELLRLTRRDTFRAETEGELGKRAAGLILATIQEVRAGGLEPS